MKIEAAALALLLAALAAKLHAEPIAINESGQGAYEASLAVAGDRLVTAWHDTRARYSQIYARWLDKDLHAAGAEFQLTHEKRHAYEPDVQVKGDELVVAWYDKDPLTRVLRAHVGAWTTAGIHRWTLQLSGRSRGGRNPVVRIVGQALFCAWLENAAAERPALWGVWLDLNGQPLTRPRRLAEASRTTWNLNAAIDELGRAWIVFDARVRTHRSELFLVVADRESQRVSRLSADDGFSSVYPDIAMKGPEFALTWLDSRDGNSEVYLMTGLAPDVTGQIAPGLADAKGRRVTQTPGDSIGAYVAWNGSRGGLAWCDNSEGQYEVFFESFAASGEVIDGPRRLTRTETWSMIPAITEWRNGFAMAWNEYRPRSRRIGASAATSTVLLTSIEAPAPLPSGARAMGRERSSGPSDDSQPNPPVLSRVQDAHPAISASPRVRGGAALRALPFHGAEQDR